jgi:AraC-like DNA-binding protein
MLRPIKIRHYVAFMRARGFRAAETLRGSGIDEKQLSDPSSLIDRRQCEAVVSNMIRLTGNQAIGFEIGAEARLSDFGVVAQAMVSSPTLGEAIELWVRHANLVGMLIHHTVMEGPRKDWTVVFSATQPLGFIYNFCVEEILLAGLKLGGALSTRKLVVKDVSLSYPAPLHARLYREHLNCPVRFNASRSSITVRSPTLDSPLPGHDPELNELYRRHCREVLHQIGTEDPVTTRLRSLFLASPGALPDLDAAARRLGCRPRTLRHRLQSEGTSFQRLLDGFRAEKSLEYLNEGGLSAKEIAGLLGFRDTNSLRRAFKCWTGVTLGQRRPRLPA